MKAAFYGVMLCACSATSFANELPPLPGHSAPSPHKLFLHSENQHSDSFDVWSVDGGYAYEVIDSVDLYVGARVNNSPTEHKSSFLSGVSYTFNDRIMLKSTLRSIHVEENEPDGHSPIAAEVSSRVKITNSLDFHATLDYQDFEQGVEVGLGFRF